MYLYLILTRPLLALTNLACARQNDFHTCKSETAPDHKNKIQFNQTKVFNLKMKSWKKQRVKIIRNSFLV